MTPRNALLAIHLGALLFGLSGIFGKLAETSPTVITLGRAAFAVLALALFARFVGGDRGARPGRRQLPALLLGGLLLGGHWVLFFQAVKVGGVAIATLGFASFPAFTLLLEALLFRERIHLREVLVVALVSVGLVLVTPEFDLASDATQGLIAAVLSGLLFALLSLLNRATTRGWTRCTLRSGRTSPSSGCWCYRCGRASPSPARWTGCGSACSACSAPASPTACSWPA